MGRIEGGPKDETPPAFLSAKPENYSINFKADEIRIQFDEFIKLKNPQQQIIFSPPISPKPIVTPLGLASKEIKIKFEIDSLKSNTTYTVNFGQSIEDNNEGNPLPFFKYVFSTGSYLDSLKLEGTVNDMYYRENPELVSVMLFEKDITYSDSIVYKNIPTYIAYAKDSTNAFSIENMKKGTYKLIALEDKNNNYKFNQGREKIGFIEGFIELPTEQNYQLNLFETQKQFKAIRPKQASNNRLIFGYEGVLDTLNYDVKLISSAPDTLETYITKEREKDTLNYHFKPYFENDSLLFAFTHKNKTDTLVVKTRELPKDSLKIELKPKGSIEITESVFVRATTPIVEYNKSKIEIMAKDSTLIDFTTKLDSFNNQLEIKFNKAENNRYNIQLLPNTITDFYGKTNDTINAKVTTKKRETYGVLQFTINNIDRYPAIVQLVDDKEKIEKSVVLTNKNFHTFENITPGEYYIKVIYDDNANGKWDAGNYLKQIQPEEVIFIAKPNTVRANWDVIETFNLP